MASSQEPNIEVITARYRAAWPELRRLPLKLSGNGPLASFIKSHAEEIKKGAMEIVKDCLPDLEDEDTDNEINLRLVNQYRMGASNTSVPTLIISAPWSKEKQTMWKKAVHDIAVWLHKLSIDLKFEHGQIHIEMIAPQLTETVHIGIVRDDAYTADSWDHVRALVHERLENFEATKGHMTSMSLFRYGLLKETDANPVTVFISVDYESDETQWLGIITDIERNIHSYGWTDVQVHMEHNIGWADSDLYD